MIKYEYKLHGKVVATADLAKYLGVTITADSRWNRHINTITSKANGTLSFLKRNRQDLCSLLPCTTYTRICYVVWDRYTKKNINKLEMVQRKAARLVESSSPGLKSQPSKLKLG